jgi:hypothetical protein
MLPAQLRLALMASVEQGAVCMVHVRLHFAVVFKMHAIDSVHM